ncbi:hypothetical protein J2T08_000506 [Neorhizobium galegae]|uniref:hypothetical protein n=1 Tax=Neorhizobium galegae TaxID=399 RepID=UPI001AEA4DD0|nr:hypothetical protein [Neorhizobium galegae]MBP2559824.1 hypothetical protein [Neorhizobium galegae]MDQ0132605.1 hypothetical protein [Neorhizobium galegae]
MLDCGYPFGNLFHLILDTEKGLFDRRLHVGQSAAKFDFDRKLQTVPNLRLAPLKTLRGFVGLERPRPDFSNFLAKRANIVIRPLPKTWPENSDLRLHWSSVQSSTDNLIANFSAFNQAFNARRNPR